MESLVGSVLAPALQNHCRLIKLKGHTKAAAESGWNLNANYSPEDAEIIAHVSSGGNYGIIPMNGLMVIDCDTEKLYNSLPVEWKASLTVITGRNGETGRHVFLYCKDSPEEKFSLNDPGTRAPLGDIRGSGSKFYTVGAGSIHPDTGRKYEYVKKDAPIVEVTWGEVQKILIDTHAAKKPEKRILAPSGNTSGTLSEQLGLRIENFAMPIKPVQKSNGEIQGAHPIHGSTTGMNFSINTQKNVWHCYRDNIGGDPVAWIAYAHLGVDEHDCTHLSQDQFVAVRNWLKDNGYAEQIRRLDDEFFEDPRDAEVDLSGILNPPELENEAEEIEKEIANAKARGILPPFPEFESKLLNDYMDFGKAVSYSIPEFHFAAAVSVISMALGRRVLIQVGMSKVYPNIYAMVVGHTTISGKSVACDIAVDTVGPAVLHEEPVAICNSTRMSRGEISAASLVQEMNDVYNRMWYFDDCSPFLESANGWNTAILGTLCTIYDGRPVERTLSRGKGGEERRWSCPTPYMSLLFNTTNTDLENLSTNRMFSSGLYPRMMWFIGQGGQPRKNVKITPENKALIQSVFHRVARLKEALKHLDNDSIVFEVSDEIEEWRLKRTMEHLGKEDESYRAAISRGFIHAYKLAAIFAMTDPEFTKGLLSLPADKYPISVQIPNRNAMDAIAIVENYLVPRTMYVHGLCSQSDEKNHQVMILKALDYFGGVAEKTKIIRRTHLNNKELTSAMQAMAESGEIKLCSRINPGAKKPTTFVLKQ